MSATEIKPVLVPPITQKQSGSDTLAERSVVAVPSNIERPAAANPSAVRIEGKAIYINNKLIMTVDDPARLATINKRLQKYTLAGPKIKISLSLDGGVARLFLGRNGIKEQIREEVLDKDHNRGTFMVWANNLKEALGAKLLFPDVKATYEKNIRKYEISIDGRIIMRAEDKYISNNTVENLKKAMFSLKPGKRPAVSVKMRSIGSSSANRDDLRLTLYINGNEIRTVGIDKADRMCKWAMNIKDCLGGRAELTGIRDARIVSKAARNIGRTYDWFKWNCSQFVSTILPASFRGGTMEMRSALRERGISRSRVKGNTIGWNNIKIGDVIVPFLVADKDTELHGEIRHAGDTTHVALCICVGKNDDGTPRLLSLENNASTGTRMRIGRNLFCSIPEGQHVEYYTLPASVLKDKFYLSV
jgi:hypothetical protein